MRNIRQTINNIASIENLSLRAIYTKCIQVLELIKLADGRYVVICSIEDRGNTLHTAKYRIDPGIHQSFTKSVQNKYHSELKLVSL